MENNQENKELEENIEQVTIINEEVVVEEENSTKGFFSRLMSGVVDQCVVIICSLAALLIMDGVLRLMGYYVDERIPVFFIIYILANIIYPTIMQGTKLRMTLGNRLFR